MNEKINKNNLSNNKISILQKEDQWKTFKPQGKAKPDGLTNILSTID
jgi:hypothetical protein